MLICRQYLMGRMEMGQWGWTCRVWVKEKFGWMVKALVVIGSHSSLLLDILLNLCKCHRPRNTHKLYFNWSLFCFCCCLIWTWIWLMQISYSSGVFKTIWKFIGGIWRGRWWSSWDIFEYNIGYWFEPSSISTFLNIIFLMFFG